MSAIVVIVIFILLVFIFFGENFMKVVLKKRYIFF